MATVLGDVMFPNGKYIKAGEEKTRWLNCGVLLQTDNGMRLKLECMPLAVSADGAWFSIFEKTNDKPVQAEKPAEKPTQEAVGKDDIPF